MPLTLEVLKRAAARGAENGLYAYQGWFGLYHPAFEQRAFDHWNRENLAWPGGW